MRLRASRRARWAWPGSGCFWAKTGEGFGWKRYPARAFFATGADRGTALVSREVEHRREVWLFLTEQLPRTVAFLRTPAVMMLYAPARICGRWLVIMKGLCLFRSKSARSAQKSLN